MAKIEQAIDYLIDFDIYSEYQKQLNILLEYIDKLEEQINESKTNK